jgi:DNA uptake protein ComE-like DNA-binding protein
MAKQARAVILPVILFVLLLLGLLGAMFSFRIYADVSATRVIGDRLQTRLAAEAGVEAVKLLLRTARSDRTQWYNNPDAFHRMLVWAHGADRSKAGTNEEFHDTTAFRFSIVADDPTDDKKLIRFGITDEASKLNLNAATDAQLLKLVETVVAGQKEGESDIDPRAMVDAIIDWRDADSKPTGEAGDTEDAYYRLLDKPYRVKNGPFSTVEELLLVKGVTGQVLFGEDFDRNGLLTPNEDDGDKSFPPDNQDGVLNRGLYPYLTVSSYEANTSNDNSPRIYLFTDEATLGKELEDVFPDQADVIHFIVAVTRAGPGVPGGGGKPSGTGGQPPGSSGGKPPAGAPGATTPPGGTGTIPPAQAPAGTPGSGKGGNKPPAGPGSTGGPVPPPGPKPPPKKAANEKQKSPSVNPSTGSRGPGSPAQSGGRKGVKPQPPGSAGTVPSGGGKPGAGVGGLPSGATTPPSGDEAEPTGDESGAGAEKPGGQPGSGDGGSAATPIRSPASLLRPRKIGTELEEPSPLTVEQLPLLMDRLTTRRATERRVPGLINVNTAPRQVLECLEGLTGEQAQSILAVRETLDAKTLSTPAWLVTEGVMDVETFDKIAASLTTRSQQFTIESLGYGDHMGMVTRLQVVVDMMGPIPQTIYYRDISYLGGSYPIREEDKEQVRGR